MPDSEVGCSPDAPRFAHEQLRELAPASCVPAPKSVPIWRRGAQGEQASYFLVSRPFGPETGGHTVGGHMVGTPFVPDRSSLGNGVTAGLS